MFDTSDTALRSYLKSIGGEGFKVKDFRTRVATQEALSSIASMKAPTNMKEYKKAVMQVAKNVSSKLGNTPSVALNSYIDPTVFGKWNKGVKI